MPLTLTRRVTFVAKAEYFNTPGIKGWFQKKFFTGAGQVPIDRSGRLGRRGRAEQRPPDPHRGRPVRHLPRGHAVPRRQALPRQDRRRPAGTGVQGAGDPDGRGRHRRRGPARPDLRQVHPARSSGSASRWTSRATRAWRTTATSCGRSPTRSCTRSCGSPARSTSTSTPARPRRRASVSSARRRRGRGPRDRRRAARAGEGVLTDAAGSAVKPSPGRRIVPAGVRRELTAWFAPAMTVEDRMFRWLAVLRVIVLVNAVVLVVYRFDNVQRPAAAVVCAAVMVALDGLHELGLPRAGSAPAAAAAGRPRGRRGADRAVAGGQGRRLQRDDPRLLGDGRAARLGGPLAVGRRPGRRRRAERRSTCRCARTSRRSTTPTPSCSCSAARSSGFLVESLQLMAAERDRAQRSAAAAVERARLARAVHDGVLQVLALVQRRGAELGGEAAELGRLAGEQEVALRTLIRAQDAVVSTPNEAMVDLAAASSALGTRPGVHVATPGSAVEVPRVVADELVAAVGACLDNVRGTSGRARRAWVLLEAFPTGSRCRCATTGPGIPEGRLREAEAEGRLGRRRVDPGPAPRAGRDGDAAHRSARHRVGARRPAGRRPDRQAESQPASELLAARPGFGTRTALFARERRTGRSTRRPRRTPRTRANGDEVRRSPQRADEGVGGPGLVCS